MPRNRTRAQRLAAGLVAVEVAITPEQRSSLDAEAARLGLSRAALIARIADNLAKSQARRNRRAASK